MTNQEAMTQQERDNLARCCAEATTERREALLKHAFAEAKDWPENETFLRTRLEHEKRKRSRDEDECRVKAFSIGRREFFDLMRPKRENLMEATHVDVPEFAGLPDDAKLVDTQYDWAMQSFIFVFHSMTYKPMAQGEELACAPMMWVGREIALEPLSLATFEGQRRFVKKYGAIPDHSKEWHFPHPHFYRNARLLFLCEAHDGTYGGNVTTDLGKVTCGKCKEIHGNDQDAKWIATRIVMDAKSCEKEYSGLKEILKDIVQSVSDQPIIREAR